MLGVLGDVVQDVVVWQRGPLRHGSDTDADVTMVRGGSAANVAAFAAPRHPTRFIGCVGDDLAGFVLGRELAERGVDVRLQTRGTTGMIVVVVDASGERTMFPSRGASALLEPVESTWLDGLRVLHLTAYSLVGGTTPIAARDAVDRVRASGGRISLDLSSAGLIHSVGVPSFLGLLATLRPDIVTANRDEWTLLGLATDGSAGPNLGALGSGTLLARDGRRPTRVFSGGALVAEVSVRPVTVVRDLTGAGDAFNAGYLADALAHGWDPAANVAAGHALAARVLSSAGATEGPVPSPGSGNDAG